MLGLPIFLFFSMLIGAILAAVGMVFAIIGMNRALDKKHTRRGYVLALISLILAAFQILWVLWFVQTFGKPFGAII